MIRLRRALPGVVRTIVVVLASTHTAFASRPCIDHYSESGDWNAGKSFRSFVELQGDLTKAFQAVGRMIAAEGFAGISASKDLGVITAYQDNNGKRSPLNAVLSEPRPGHIRVEVVFQLAPGLRAPTAALKDELCKVLEAALPTDQQAAAAAAAAESSGIALRGTGKDMPLAVTVGATRQAGVFPVMLLYSDFSGAHAGVRTKPRDLALVVRAPDDPSKKYVLVKLDSHEADDRRSLKMMSGRKLLKAGITGKVDFAPDPDWTLPFAAQQEAPSVWRLAPASALQPGEYGLWDIEGMGLAAFGVDG
jgi:hypothetical protein